MSLKPEHHGELSKANVSSSRYDELRQEYADDKEALKDIDRYDPSSDYRIWFREYRDALRKGDQRTAIECERWFKENGF